MIKTTFLGHLIAAFVFASLFAGCGSSAVKKSSVSSVDDKEAAQVQHSFAPLKLQVEAPETWRLAATEFNNQVIELGASAVDSGNKMIDQMLAQSVNRTVVVFTLTEYEIGSPVEENPMLMSMIEDITLAPGVKTGCDYLFHMKQNLALANPAMEIVSDCQELEINGKTFGVIDTQFPVGRQLVKQNYFVSVCNSYSLAFVATYLSDQAKAELAEIVKSTSYQCDAPRPSSSASST